MKCCSCARTNAIVQASDLKVKLEQLAIRQNEVTIILIDAVDMCPSIKCSLVRKAINFFAENLSDKDKKQSAVALLAMMKFAMGNTLLTFIDKYYEYGGSKSVEERAEEEMAEED